MARFSPLAVIERVGNRLPDPATLFVIGCALVLLGSWWAASSGWSVAHPSKPGEMVTAVNLLAVSEQRWIWLNAIRNFLDFHPLGVVLVAMLGIGVAERTGLFAAILKLIVLATPAKLLTPAVIFAGVMSSAAADASSPRWVARRSSASPPSPSASPAASARTCSSRASIRSCKESPWRPRGSSSRISISASTAIGIS
jgi:hypothetical protein